MQATYEIVVGSALECHVYVITVKSNFPVRKKVVLSNVMIVWQMLEWEAVAALAILGLKVTDFSPLAQQYKKGTKCEL